MTHLLNNYYGLEVPEGAKWTKINWHNDNYEISSGGDVGSLIRGKRIILKTWVSSHGYTIVRLSHKNKRTTKTVHRLVALAFIPNPKNLPTVNHKNGIKSDNRLQNLEWCGVIENILHARKIGIVPKPSYEKKYKPCIQTDLNGVFISSFASAVEAHKKTGVYLSGITKCARGEVKTAGKYKWQYQ